jgi:hypothetical protein
MNGVTQARMCRVGQRKALAERTWEDYPDCNCGACHAAEEGDGDYCTIYSEMK